MTVAGVIAVVVAALAGYLIGGLPSAALVARLKGKRIFEVGSGNMGAMNTARNLGWGLGVLVLIMDVAKGALAGFVGLVLGGEVAGVAAGCGAVAGHAWSPFVGFRGGKALSTALGVALPVYPLVGLGGLALLITFMVIFRHTPLAPVFAIALYPFLAALILIAQGDAGLRLISVTLGVIIIGGTSATKHLRALRAQAETA